MFIGGFYSLDLSLMQKEPEKRDLELRCDPARQYDRKFYTNNGRTATVYALQNGLRLTERDTILVPDYLCVSVLNALETTGARFRFYRVRADLTADVEDLKQKMDETVKVLYVIHYFGVPQPAEVAETVLALKRQSGAAIVEDLTQTLYSRGAGRIGFGDFLVASTRKWTPVTDGGILAVRSGLAFSPEPLKDAYDKAAYTQLLISLYRAYYAEHPEADVGGYLQMEKEANAARYLDFSPKAMTEQAGRILFNFDHSLAMRRRRENYRYLYESLREAAGIRLLAKPLDAAGDIVPFGFPILVEARDACYRYLAEHGILGEIQWILPTSYYTPGADAQALSDHNIMLQCDQRYGETEMRFVADCLKRYCGTHA